MKRVGANARTMTSWAAIEMARRCKRGLLTSRCHRWRKVKRVMDGGVYACAGAGRVGRVPRTLPVSWGVVARGWSRRASLQRRWLRDGGGYGSQVNRLPVGIRCINPGANPSRPPGLRKEDEPARRGQLPVGGGVKHPRAARKNFCGRVTLEHGRCRLDARKTRPAHTDRTVQPRTRSPSNFRGAASALGCCRGP